MANAHLPNSHPEVTQDWIEPKRKLTPFATALQTKLDAGTDNVYKAYVERDWCTPAPVGWVAHGGYCCALIIDTNKKYMETNYPERKQPDPIHLHVQYLSPLPAGAITLTITNLQLGTKHSVLQITLTSPKSKSNTPSIISLVTQGNISVTPLKHRTINVEIEKEKLPNRETECARWTDARFFITNPTSVRYRSFTVKGGPNPMWSPLVGKNRRDKWVKVDEEGQKMGLAHLGVIVDLIPPLPLHYEKNALAGMMTWAFPSICLSLDIKRDPEGEEWLLQRTEMTQCENGRYELDIKIIDEKGQLVTTSKHEYLVVLRTGREPEGTADKSAML